LTGETQLRARRTRLKILRAIAGSKGSAGFSEIRDATGLSTGSIYYHLERMSKYIIKDAKQYLITQHGWDLLREIDVKSPDVRKDECSESDDQRPEPIRVGSKNSIALNFIRGNRFVLLAIAIVASISVGIYSQSYALFPGISYAGKMIANATMISSLSIAALLSLSFLIMLRRQMIPKGYRVLMISSLTVVSVILVNILIFTGLGTQIVINPSISYAGKMIANATMISSLSIAALLSLSFLIMLRRQMIHKGYRVLMISSLTVVSVILVNILIFTGLGTQIGSGQLTY
jgi:Bacterial regulatory protein, arsR family